MRELRREKEYIYTKKLIAAICLTALFSCPLVQAQELITYSPISTLSNTKVIKLDTTNIKKEETLIPHNLRNFNESDYFSSTAMDETESYPTLQIDKLNISESKPENNQLSELPTIKQSSAEEMIKNIEFSIKNQQRETYIPAQVMNGFFTPNNLLEVETKSAETVETVETVNTNELEETIVQTKDDLPALEEISEKELFKTGEVEIVENPEDTGYNGKLISALKIEGVDKIQEDYILSQINTKETSLYNEMLLQKDLQKIYSTGYFTDEMTVEPLLNSDDTITLVYTVNENILVNDVSLQGNTVFTEEELKPYISELKDLPQNLNEINVAIEKINKHYHDKGYVLAKVSSVDDDEQGNLTFVIQEGIINKIDISGNESTKDYVITRNIMTKEGSIYNEEFLKKDLSKVFSTQVFDDVTKNIMPTVDKDGYFDVTVIVREKVTNSIGFGGGIDTGLGAFGSISFKEDNFLGKAQRISLNGILGSGILLSDSSIKDHANYQVELNFVEPYFLNADNSLMSKLYYRELGSWSVPLAIERRIGAYVGVEHRVKNCKHLTTSLNGGIEHIHLKEGDYSRIKSLYNYNNLNIANRAKQLSDGMFINIAPGIKYSNLDSEENPRNGIIAQARYTETLGLSNFNHTHGRVSGMITKFFPVFKKSTFSLTAKAGAKVHGDHMPEVMAYRLGGPYTIRGYRMSGVGVGDSFVMGSAELATPLPFVDKLKWDIIKNMRLTFFVDAGKVYNPTITNILFDRPEHAISAGVGLRIYIPGIGPISVDYGLPITNPGNFGSEHGYFTFGSGGLNMYNYW